jgi:hypothetical protein
MSFVDFIFINCIVIAILCALKEPFGRLMICLFVDRDTRDNINNRDNVNSADNINNTSSYKNAKVAPLYDDVHIVIINPCDFQIGTVSKVLPE